MAGISGVVLAIVGGIKATKATTWDQYNYDLTLRRAGMILFIILFFGTHLVTAICWLNWKRILRYRRKVSTKWLSCI